MKIETEEFDESVVTLDTYNSDLNLVIDASKYSAHPLTNEGFAFMWAGARATHGAKKGKLCFEVKVLEHLDVSHLPSDEPNPHVVRVGFSVESSTLQLGEDPLSYGYGGTGKISTNCQFKDFGSPFMAGDCILAVVNMDSDPIQMGFAKNGNFLGWAYKISKNELQGKALFPHILTKNCSFEVNFGQKEQPYFSLPDVVKDFTFVGCLSIDQREGGTRPPLRREDCEMIMMCGLPGAGKSVWAADYSLKHPDKKYNVLGTNNIIDKMKVMGLPRKRNYAGRWDVLIQMATKCLNKMFEIGSKLRRNYILDQTNVYPTAQRRKMRNFEGFKRIAVVVVPTEEEYKRRCDKRDREEGKDIPDQAVLEMKANFKLPEVNDIFDDVIYTELPKEDAEKLVRMYNEEGKAAVGPPRKQFRPNEPSGFGAGRGFDTGRGNFITNRSGSGPGRGGFAGRGGYDSGRGGLEGSRGGHEGGRGGRGGYDGGRGGGYDGGRGGGYEGGRSGGYEGGRGGGYDGGRGGGYDGGRGGGYDGGRGGGYDGGRGSGYDSGRGSGYDSGRGGYEGSRGGRGGYDGGRGGYDSGRGGYDGGRGGFEGSRGGYGSNRGGYDGGRGGFDRKKGFDDGPRRFDHSQTSHGNGNRNFSSSSPGGYSGGSQTNYGYGSSGGYGESSTASFGNNSGGYSSRGSSRGNHTRGDYGGSRGSSHSGYGGRDFDSSTTGSQFSDSYGKEPALGAYDKGGSSNTRSPRGFRGGASRDGSRGGGSRGNASNSRGSSASSRGYGSGNTGSRGGYNAGDYNRDVSSSYSSSYSSYQSDYGEKSQGSFRSGSEGYNRRDSSSSYMPGPQGGFKKEPGQASDVNTYETGNRNTRGSTRPSGRTGTRWSAETPPAYSQRGSTGTQESSTYSGFGAAVKTEPAATTAGSRYDPFTAQGSNYGSYSQSSQPAQAFTGTQTYGYQQGMANTGSQPWTGAQAGTGNNQAGQGTAEQPQWSQYYQQQSQPNQYFSQYYGQPATGTAAAYGSVYSTK